MHNDKKINPSRKCTNLKCLCRNNSISQHMKQKLIELKREIDNSTSLIKDFKTPCLAINRLQDRELGAERNWTVQQDLVHMNGTLCPATVKSTFFSSTHGTFTWVSFILGHKINLNRFKRIENHIQHVL